MSKKWMIRYAVTTGLTASLLLGSMPLPAAPSAKTVSATPQTRAFIPDEAYPAHHWTTPSVSVLIDAGHGGIDGGAFHEDVLEKHINLAIARKLYLLLRSQGVNAVLNRTGDYALSDDNGWHNSRSRHQRDLSQRTELTGEIHTEMLLSLHVNWSRSPAVRGPLVLHQDNGESALLAYCIQDALNVQQNKAYLPRRGKPFYLLNRVKQPAVIVEMGFISNAEDRAMLTNVHQQTVIASAIASGVRHYKLLAH
ncbi:N-acetylmuramoyl-L-alanine amidase [Paenibacillus sp. GCM10023252]|uniref:N-acetylmuramoyl-L-alanine amidase family protein n=1 Tax=Paenibacillus sp. GCM10023252 TaxID=3252649 RepID=UPI00361CB553